MATWMLNIQNVLLNKHINEIILPGSHDSAAYHVDFGPEFKSSNKWMNLLSSSWLRKFPCIQAIIRNWTITQNMNLYQQLCSGIRVLDLRISYLTHTFINDTLENGLQQIYDFVKAYPSEIILLKFTHDYQHREKITPDVKKKLFDQIQQKLSESIYMPRKKHLPKYKELLYKKKNILIFYDHIQAWSISLLQLEWLNQSTVIEFNNNLLNYLQKHTSSSKGFFYTITPSSDTVYKGIFCRGPSSLQDINQLILNKFDILWPEISVSPNKIIMFDFPSTEIIQTLIESNC
jgi:hypothetical protein